MSRQRFLERRNLGLRDGRTRLAGICLVATLVAAMFAFGTAGRSGEVRNWKSASGTFSTDAELLEVTADGAVRLKKADGKEIKVPLDKLSPADQEYARAHAGGAAAGAVKPSGPPKSPAEVEEDASGCKTAKEAVLVYQFYLANPNLAADQRAAAEAKKKEWDKLAAEDKVRIGKNWLSKEEAKKIQEQANKKIEQALEYLRLANGDLARKTLEEASKLDPDSIQADFLMGFVYSAIANNDKKAEQYFQKCLKREPDNVSVMNNLAVTMVFQKKYGPAAAYWKAAATQAPTFKGLTQNIGSLITMAGVDPKVKIPEKVMSDLTEVYNDLTTKHGQPKPAEVGFVLTPPYGKDWKGTGRGGESGDGKKEKVVVSSGSGFVIAPNIIMTNRHVTHGSTSLLVLDPKNPKANAFQAELIAEVENPDLALVRCKGLNATPLVLLDKLPTRGTDIMVLGYPLGPAFGVTLKSTRGAITAMPDSSKENMFLHDALTNPGNSGGPLVDKCGRVAGVVRAIIGAEGGVYGCGIPIADALPFIKQHVTDFKVESAAGKELNWPDVDTLVAPSTVLIMCQEEVSESGVQSVMRK